MHKLNNSTQFMYYVSSIDPQEIRILSQVHLIKLSTGKVSVLMDLQLFYIGFIEEKASTMLLFVNFHPKPQMSKYGCDKMLVLKYQGGRC